MWTWIANAFDPAGRAPAPLADLAESLGDLRRLSGLRTEEGGIERERVTRAIAAQCLAMGLHEDKAGFMDFVDVAQSIGVRTEAGRALTNNGAVIAVLRAAQDPDVRRLVLVVPQAYKSSAVFPAVNAQIVELLNGRGVALALDGVALLPY